MTRSVASHFVTDRHLSVIIWDSQRLWKGFPFYGSKNMKWILIGRIQGADHYFWLVWMESKRGIPQKNNLRKILWSPHKRYRKFCDPSPPTSRSKCHFPKLVTWTPWTPRLNTHVVSVLLKGLLLWLQRIVCLFPLHRSRDETGDVTLCIWSWNHLPGPALSLSDREIRLMQITS